jgi:hypothetical protein
VRPLWRLSQGLKRAIAAARTEVQAALANVEQWNGTEALDGCLALISDAHPRVEACLLAYEAPVKALDGALKAVVCPP